MAVLKPVKVMITYKKWDPYLKKSVRYQIYNWSTGGLRFKTMQCCSISLFPTSWLAVSTQLTLNWIKLNWKIKKEVHIATFTGLVQGGIDFQLRLSLAISDICLKNPQLGKSRILKARMKKKDGVKNIEKKIRLYQYFHS